VPRETRRFIHKPCSIHSENIMTQHFVARTLRPVTLDSADATQKEVLAGALKAVGFIPNMYANMVKCRRSPPIDGYAAASARSRA
jgi:hypothetical protein